MLVKMLQTLATTVAVRLDLGDLLTVMRSGLFLPAWFLDLNPDIAAAGIDPVAHYCRYGWQEGRFPNPYFDPAWYLQSNSDVRESRSEPLLHYIEYGEAEGRQPIGHFDPNWYRTKHQVPAGQGCLQHFLLNRQNGLVSPIPEFDAEYYRCQSPDVVIAGMDPFEHYLVRGAMEGRNPSAAFDTAGYRRLHLGDRLDVNPLLHHRQHRKGRVAAPPSDTDIPREVRRNTQPGPLFEAVEPLPPDTPRRATVLAFYLPQFHPIPENDAWWGQGFTEWTNVARGLPRFAGHYQPRIPRDLGHYRLDTAAAVRAQVALARGAGLGGFVYYFYWFNGQRLLNGPLDAMLADPGNEFPFCLMWANENWTRRWDGAEQDVLIAQDYRESDEPALVAEFVRHFADPRYIRLQGRPVLMVYRAGLIPGAAQAVMRWRDLFRAHGDDPLFVMAQSFDDRDPRAFGMDAAVEFPPHKLAAGLPMLNAGLHMLDRSATAQVFAYDGVAAASNLAPSPFPLIRTALPGWDNDARRQGAGMVLHGSTPAKYQAWLTRLIDAAVAQPVAGTPLVCVNAWNEWAEGAYLEPDVHFGGAYLNATGRAIACCPAREARTRLLLVGHDAFPAGAQLLLLSLGRHCRAVMGLDIAFLLCGGGALADEFRAVAPTTIATGPDDLPRLAHAFRAQGFTSAVVNSAASSNACLALAGAGITCTLLVHELPRLLLERNLAGPAQDAAAVARRVVFASPFVRDRFAQVVSVPPGRSVVLPQGLYGPVRNVPAGDAARAAMRDKLGVPHDALVAMGLGYADLRKGFDLFLQAWRIAHAARAGVCLVWIGDIDPSVQAYLGAEVEAAQATGTFRHVPRCANAADWLACADVHLLTSREDPFPSVVLEAMSAGVPTVAFEGAGGAPALLLEYGAGVAVPLGDADAMVRQLRILAALSQPADRARLAARTRRDFDFGAYAGRLLRLAAPDLLDVSVVVPTYNYGRYLGARIASIAAQTYPVGEVIVLDDASTDESAAVVERAAAKAGRAVRWVGQDSNSGSVFRQWRRAVDLAQGEWLWIAEADDMAEPGFLAALCTVLENVPDAVMAFTDSRAVDADGMPLWPDHQDYYARAGAPVLAQDGVHPAADLLDACLSRRNLILNASAVLWRRTALRRALDRCGAELDSFTMAGDWRVYAEVLSAGGSIAYVAQPLNIHRRHAASVTHRLTAKLHLAEVARMQRHMRGLLGSSPALLAGQRRAMQEARAALAAGQLATG